jgi:hypothetical protein
MPGHRDVTVWWNILYDWPEKHGKGDSILNQKNTKTDLCIKILWLQTSADTIVNDYKILKKMITNLLITNQAVPFPNLLKA